MPKDQKGRYCIILDDDPMVARMVESALECSSVVFTSSDTFASRASRYEPVGVIVDVHLGIGDNGLDLLPSIRERWPYVPVLVVTGTVDEKTIGQALASGANDFVRKPIMIGELRARFQVRAAEMAERAGRDLITLADVRVDTRLHKISSDAGVRHLSAGDIQLLAYLARTQGTLVAKDELKRKVWGDAKVSDGALDKRLHEVRHALKDLTSKVKIEARYGRGVRLVVASGADSVDEPGAA